MSAPGLGYLAGRLGVVGDQVRRVVTEAQADDPHPDDPFRGLYLSRERAEAIAGTPRTPVGLDADLARRLVELEGEAAGTRLHDLAVRAGLGDLDVAVLLVALLPDIDESFESLYGYLNDDVTRRRPTVGLALRLCGVPAADVAGRSRFDVGAPLIAGGLLAVEDPARPLLSRGLRVPDRVGAHLLGADHPDVELAGVLVAPVDDPVADLPGADVLARALEAGVGLVHLREPGSGGGRDLAVAGLAAAGRPALCADAAAVTAGLPGGEQTPTVVALLREAVLTGAGVVLGPLEELVAPGRTLAVLRHAAVPVLVHGAATWEPRWSATPPLSLEVAPAPRAVRDRLWKAGLAGRLADGVDPAAATAHLRLEPGQIRRATAAAGLAALGEGTDVDVRHLRLGARSQNAAGLERLARRIEPAVTWADLVLPDTALAELTELAARARHREQVLRGWRMRPGGGRGRGVTALFAGDSGTGKTLSAEVIAADLGLDLYAVDLATVVDKYVGETEKNLERIFDQAAGVNGVLLFDEADALFGKRSEVRDAHDRYANIESAYLLQRMEAFDGLAVLATNLRANLDDAFTRRLDAVVDFPLPDAASRRRLWDACLGVALPRATDVDLGFLADSFDLSGGHIRSASVTAAYLAAGDGAVVTMAHLVRAVAREYRKLGRLCLEREFGEHLASVTELPQRSRSGVGVTSP